MIDLVQIDRDVSFLDQLKDDVAPAVLVNIFQFSGEHLQEVLDAWVRDADFMKKQPGFISAQLHKGVAGSNMLLNYALWSSTEDLRRAFISDEFQSYLKKYPQGVTASPHVFQLVGVSGICEGSDIC